MNRPLSNPSTEPVILPRRSRASTELSIVVPTYNECRNIELIVQSVESALGETGWEIIFVDDNSPDGTSGVARSVAARDGRVRCIRRIGRKGLSTAVIEGMLSSSAAFVAVMDGDLQHDETLLALMLSTLKADACDIAIASRYVGAGSASGLDGTGRHARSQLGNWLARSVLKVDLSDPMSGFFMMRRFHFDGCAERLSGEGFKILLDVMTSLDTAVRVRELPMTFRSRAFGESKLDLSAEIAFLNMLFDKTAGRIVPRRFLIFSAVGSTGVVVHLAALKLALLAGLAFDGAQASAALTAMASNFFLNNAVTFRDQRLRGKALVTGFLSFCAVCSFGFVGNVGIARTLFEQDSTWWLAGLVGAIVGAVWNYGMTSFYTWKSR